MVEIERCWCDKHPGQPCTARVTQEDMRCDICRDRCILVTFSTLDGSRSWSMHAGPVTFTAPEAGIYTFHGG